MEVEIWSDVACPWCYVGKRRFEAALEQFEHRDDVTITWRSFELDPEAPAEREGDRAEHLASKYGMSLEQAHQAEAQMTQTAAADGLDFRFDIARAGNTFDGHRLVHLAKAHGLQDVMKERLLHAYFSEGELVSDHDALTRLAVEVGLPEDEVRGVWIPCSILSIGTAITPPQGSALSEQVACISLGPTIHHVAYPKRGTQSHVP